MIINMEKHINLSEEILEKKENLIEKLKENPVELIEERRIVTIDELRGLYIERRVLICDVYVENMEKKKREGLLFRDENVYSIDHHAPMPEYERKVSSTNFAIEYVKENGPIGKDFAVITNHTDADSILSCLIMRGVLPPDEKYGAVAIAADHTGGKNEIADLLQAAQYERDVELSVRNLQLLLDGATLEERAQALLDKRSNERDEAEKLVNGEKIKKTGDVYYIELEEKIDPNFFVDAIPDAMIFLTFSKHKKFPENLEVRARLGSAGMEKGISLLEIGIAENVDPNWGGRWNAGSDKRAGGTDLSCDDYAFKLNKQLQEYLGRREK